MLEIDAHWQQKMLLMRDEEIKLLTRTRSGSSCSVRTASYSSRIHCTVLQVLGGGKREAKITLGSRVRKQEKKGNIRSRFQEGGPFFHFCCPTDPKIYAGGSCSQHYSKLRCHHNALLKEISQWSEENPWKYTAVVLTSRRTRSSLFWSLSLLG